MTRLLVDGDLVVYRIAASLETSINWGDDLWTVHVDAQEGYVAFQDYCNGVRDKVGADTIEVCFSDPKANFRKTISDTYKANRTARKPIGLRPIINKVKESYITHETATLEADDLLGLMHTKYPTETVMLSDDKDMFTIPGFLFAKGELHFTSPEQAHKNWMCQTLVGDSADNYPGCPTVGIKTALKLMAGLTKLDEMWEVVLATYEKKGKTHADAVENARLARILQDGEFDFKTGAVRLWIPKTA